MKILREPNQLLIEVFFTLKSLFLVLKQVTRAQNFFTVTWSFCVVFYIIIWALNLFK